MRRDDERILDISPYADQQSLGEALRSGYVRLTPAIFAQITERQINGEDGSQSYIGCDTGNGITWHKLTYRINELGDEPFIEVTESPETGKASNGNLRLTYQRGWLTTVEAPQSWDQANSPYRERAFQVLNLLAPIMAANNISRSPFQPVERHPVVGAPGRLQLEGNYSPAT